MAIPLLRLFQLNSARRHLSLSAGAGLRDTPYLWRRPEDPRAPFNRADFYVATPAGNMPSKCAPNTGILYKAVMNQSDGEFGALPLLDCVADMQVVFITDADADGTPEWNNAEFTSGLTAEQIRAQVKGWQSISWPGRPARP